MTAKARPPWRQLSDYWARQYFVTQGCPYCSQGVKDSSVLKALLVQFKMDDIKETMNMMLASTDSWLSTHKELRFLRTNWNRLHLQEQQQQGGRATTLRSLDNLERDIS